MPAITWCGQFEGYQAYPIINRHFTRILKERGYSVYENMHNAGNKITPNLVVCEYPPKPVYLPHERKICVINWEFVGPDNTPYNWKEVFKDYDYIWAKSQQAKDAFEEAGVENVVVGRLGVDPDEFKPEGAKVDYRRHYNLPDDSIIVLWLGGTDARHGFDIALEVLKHCPDHVYLVAKQHADYPLDEKEHNRLILIHEHVESLAPYYRGADVFLQTARAVGYSLPTAEAIACGLPVVSTDLPAIREFELDCTLRPPILYVESELEYMVHHLHKDCSPYWWEPKNIDTFKMGILALKNVRFDQPESEVWRQNHSWNSAVDQLIPYLVK